MLRIIGSSRRESALIAFLSLINPLNMIENIQGVLLVSKVNHQPHHL